MPNRKLAALPLAPPKGRKLNMRRRLTAQEERELHIAAMEQAVIGHPPTGECPDSECFICAYRDCPFHEELHYHHDGCPACSEFWPVIQEAIWRELEPLATPNDKIRWEFKQVVYRATDNVISALAKKGMIGNARQSEVAEVRP